MTRDELQTVADTAWMILGPDGFGITVAEEPMIGGFRIDVTGFEGGTMYHFSETFTCLEVDQQRGNTRYNYIRQIIARVRRAITDLRMCQIQQSLDN